MNHPLPPKPSAAELARAKWFKGSRSTGGNGCVEVAHLADWTGVRDSKNPGRPVHLYTPHEWECFIAGAREGEFDRL